MAKKYRKLLYLLIFGGLALVALQIPLSFLLGSNARFTVFDVFAPAASGLLGTSLGLIATLIAEAINLIIHGIKHAGLVDLIRLLPVLAAGLYFSQRSKWILLIPVGAMVAFNLDPVGRSVWYYSMFWLIPLACYFFWNRSIIVRALGATFTAHALGGAMWIYVFHLSKAAWISLIPTVIFERLVFTASMVVIYYVMRTIWQDLPLRHARPTTAGAGNKTDRDLTPVNASLL